MASILQSGRVSGRKLGDMVGTPAPFVDPVCVDEMTESGPLHRL